MPPSQRSAHPDQAASSSKSASLPVGFDPIHSGHIQYLLEAKKLGDILVVALNSDEWLIKKKGKEFIVAQTDEEIDEYLAVEKRSIKINFSHTGKKTLYIKPSISEQRRLKINSLMEALKRLRKQMLANTSI